MKPGWKTTEMWATATVAWLMTDVMGASDNPVVIGCGCIAVALVACAYIWSRSKAKEGADV
tara:strand:+ start:1158 stop:1340 length:183 start_codon:yes stop_codon:yes gene_type:complete